MTTHIQKTINYDRAKVDSLAEKYPGITFTKLVDMGLELLLLDGGDPTTLKHVQSLILDYNRLKQSYREFKDDVDNRLIMLETRLQ